MDPLIKNISDCVPLSAADEEIIKSLFHKKAIKKDEHLLEEGQVCRDLFFIEKGLVRYYLSNNGEEQIS